MSILNIKILGNISPFSSYNNNCPGYLINNNTEKILLDCGFGISKELNMPEDLNSLNIFITHFHKDHYADLYAIGYASYCFHRLGKISKKIDVYIPKMTNEEEGYLDYKLLKEFKENYFNIIEYTEESILNINDFKITFHQTKHSIKNYAINIVYKNKKISYSGDMGFSNIDEISSFFNYSDLLICETTYLKKDKVLDDNHLNTEQLAEIVKKSNTKNVYFTHTWPKYSRNLYYKELKKMLKYNKIIHNKNNIKL